MDEVECVSRPHRHEMLEAMLKRCGERYARAVLASGAKPGLIDPPPMTYADRKRLREWFEDWHLTIQEQYRITINADNAIIGKQWLYDNTNAKYKLP